MNLYGGFVAFRNVNGGVLWSRCRSTSDICRDLIIKEPSRRTTGVNVVVQRYEITLARENEHGLELL